MTQIFEKAGVESLKKSFKPLLALFLKWLVANKELIKSGLIKFISGIGKAIKKLVDFTIEWQRVLKPLAALLAVVFTGVMAGSIARLITLFGALKIAALKAFAVMVAPWVALAVVIAAVLAILEDVWLTFTNPKALTVTRLLIKEFKENFPAAFAHLKKMFEEFEKIVFLALDGLKLLFFGLTGDAESFSKQLGIVNRDLREMKSITDGMKAIFDPKTYVGAIFSGGNLQAGGALSKATEGVGTMDFLKALIQHAVNPPKEDQTRMFTPAGNTININVDSTAGEDPYTYGQSLGAGVNQSLQSMN